MMFVHGRMTGTAVNPCLRAAFLAKDESCRVKTAAAVACCTQPGKLKPDLVKPQVLLVVPWLQQRHQALVFPDGLLFERPEQQTQCIRSWIKKRAGFEPSFEAGPTVRQAPCALCMSCMSRSQSVCRHGNMGRVQVVYFAARYDDYILGILPVGDVTEVIPPGNTDLVVLEEPEHLTWHHHGNQWREQFSCVVSCSAQPCHSC